MNKKKIIYRVAIVVVLILGYFNYFGEEKEIEKKEEIVETIKAIYDTNGYHIEADKQKDFLEKNETTFEMAKAILGNTILTGNNGILDAGKDLLLKNNIVGKALNGWTIKTEELKYTKDDGKVRSNIGVTAINEEKNIEISGHNFTGDINFNELILSGDVKLKFKDTIFSAEQATYNNKNKEVIVSGKVFLTDNKPEDERVISGEFDGMKYNTETKILTTSKSFNIDYDGVKLFGDKLELNQETGAFKVSENVYFLIGGYNIKVDTITSDGGEIINFNGKVFGDNGENSFEGKRGVYNKTTQKLYLYENVVAKSNDLKNKIFGDEAVYNLGTKDLEVLGKNKNVIFESGNEKYQTKSMKYNTESGDIVFDKKLENSEYTFESEKINYSKENKKLNINSKYKISGKNKKEIFVGESGEYNFETFDFKSFGKVNIETEKNIITGENLIYNRNTEIGTLEKNVKILDKDTKDIVTGDVSEFKKGEFAKIKENVILKNGDLKVSGKEAIYDFKKQTLNIPNEFTFINDVKQFSGKMKSGVYYITNKNFEGKNFTGKDVENDLKSDIIKYDAKNSKITLKNNAKIINKDGVLSGNLLEYNEKENLAYSKEKFRLENGEFKVDGIDGKVNMKTSELEAKNVYITDDTNNFRGDLVTGTLNNMNLDFQNNVSGKVINETDTYIFNGDFARVYFKKDSQGKNKVQRMEIKKNAKIEIENQNAVLTSDYIEIDNDRKLIYAKDNSKIVIIDEDNAKITMTSVLMNGDLNNETLDLVGKVDILREGTDEVVRGNSDKAKLRKKDQIIEMKGNVKFDNAEVILEADEADYNLVTKKIKARGDVFVDYKTSKTVKNTTLRPVGIVYDKILEFKEK